MSYFNFPTFVNKKLGIESAPETEQQTHWWYRVKAAGRGNRPNEKFKSERCLEIGSVVQINDKPYKVLQELKNGQDESEGNGLWNAGGDGGA